MFRDFSTLELSSERKKLICKVLTSEVILCEHWDGVRDFCRKYNLNRETVRGWLKNYCEGRKIHDSATRPPNVDNQGREEVLDSLVESRNTRKAMTVGKVKDLLIKKVSETDVREGRAPRKVSRMFFYRFRKANDIKTVQGQTITNARVTACSDLRMFLSMFVMLKSFTGHLNPYLIWNFDGTQFVCKDSGADSLVCYVLDKNNRAPVTSEAADSLPMAIKWLHGCSAAGEAIPLVLLVAIPEMGQDDFFWSRVPGLQNTAAVGGFGYLAFTKTRAGNGKFFKWFLETVAIPTVVDCRDHHELKVTEHAVNYLLVSTCVCLCLVSCCNLISL